MKSRRVLKMTGLKGIWLVQETVRQGQSYWTIMSLRIPTLLMNLAIGCSLAVTATAQTARLPIYQVGPTSGSITIDGKLDDKAWQKATLIGNFVNNKDGSPSNYQTEARVLYDEKFIYFAFRCIDDNIWATMTRRDQHLWEEEVVEFFVTPKELGRYFELQWNPLGGVFDAIITNDLDPRGVSKTFQGDWSYTAKGMQSAVKVKGTVNDSSDKDEFWQVEIRLPFADLGQPAPKPGETWRANFYRFNRTKGLPVEQLSWSPTLLPGFHQPSRFGYLEFGK